MNTKIQNTSPLINEQTHQNDSHYNKELSLNNNNFNVEHILSEHFEYEIGNGYIKCLRSNTLIRREPEEDSLSYFIVHNNLEKLKTLLIEGFDPNERDESGVTCSWTPLYWSAKLRNLEAIKTLLEYGASLNLVVHDEDEVCGTVLDLATLRNDDELEILLRDNAKETGVDLSNSFKAIRFKCRGKAPSFDFRK